MKLAVSELVGFEKKTTSYRKEEERYAKLVEM
jgi:hypothetical protein